MQALSNLKTKFSPVALLPLLLALSGCDKYNASGNLRFFWIIIIILDIIAMINVFQQDWSIGKKILWIAIIYFLPFIGLLLYYTISGRNKPVS